MVYTSTNLITLARLVIDFLVEELDKLEYGIENQHFFVVYKKRSIFEI